MGGKNTTWYCFSCLCFFFWQELTLHGYSATTQHNGKKSKEKRMGKI